MTESDTATMHILTKYQYNITKHVQEVMKINDKHVLICCTLTTREVRRQVLTETEVYLKLVLY